MEIPAKVSSKGQVTIPAEVREALGLRKGSRLIFHLEEGRLTAESEDSGHVTRIESAPDFFVLAGSVPVPSSVRGKDWKEIRRLAIRSHVDRGRETKR